MGNDSIIRDEDDDDDDSADHRSMGLGCFRRTKSRHVHAEGTARVLVHDVADRDGR